MLTRRIRLRSGRDFRAVYSRCRTVSSPGLVLSVRQWKHGRPGQDQGDPPYARFGFSISKKTAKRAHDRNKLKRRLREIVRQRILTELNIAVDTDIIFSARIAAVSVAFEDLAEDVTSLLSSSGLLRNES